MDFTPIITQAINSLWPLILIATLAIVIKLPWFKGIAGEFIVNIGAKLFLDKGIYHLINNVTLPTEDGSTQIDHIIISTFGVFVIETKNMKGWIYGREKDDMWTQKLGKKNYPLQNPLRQNYKHTKTLQSLLGLSDAQLFSLIVFVGASTFKKEMPENVTYGKGYINFIKSKNEVVIADSQVESIIKRIQTARLTPSFKTNREHVNHVQSILTAKENKQNCPKCSSTMIIRDIKKGPKEGKQLWGCSKYPKCRGTINIT